MLRLVTALGLISLTSTTVVKWIPNTSFNLPINFKDGKLPCSKQTVVFPETLSAAVKIEGDFAIAGLVLPDDGEIVLEPGTISFGADSNETSCIEGNNVYVQRSLSAWNQPDVWSSPRFNKATPDAERVPCFDDTVEFPENEPFTCQLPDKNQQVSKVKIGKKNYQTFPSAFFDLGRNRNSMRRFVLNSKFNMGVEIISKTCNSRAGCPCQEHPLKMDCVVKYCPVPSCVEPIKPIGHCCKICGGALVFDLDQSFDIHKFVEFVENIINSYNGLVYHVGRIGDKVQLVVVEDKNYDGSSSEAVNKISHWMEKHWVRSEKTELLSGSPMYKYGLGGKLFVSMFFAVVLVMTVVYLYYYKLPDIRYPVMGRSWLSSLARFERRSDSLVSLTRRDSAAPGFRNPLYDSRRGRVQVQESAVED